MQFYNSYNDPDGVFVYHMELLCGPFFENKKQLKTFVWSKNFEVQHFGNKINKSIDHLLPFKWYPPNLLLERDLMV